MAPKSQNRDIGAEW